ncbi:MAG TPA: response regulator [Burkholderiaceae bacterium]
MKNENPENNAHFFSTLPAGPNERLAARWLVGVSAVLFCILLPFAKLPLPHNPTFIPVYETLLVVTDLITAVLLFGQYRILRSRALLCLASAYLFAAFMEVGHALSFPNGFASQGLIGGGTQTTAWIYVFWHGGFPLFVMAYALTKGRIAPPGGGITAGIVGAGFALLAALLLVRLATSGAELPVLIVDNVSNGALAAALSVVWLLCAGALLLLWRSKPLVVLDLWLMVVLWAWLFDIGLSALFNAGRYDLGFYAGRIYGAVAAGFVLTMLLLENVRLYAQLADAHDKARRESRELQVLGERLENANRLLGESNRQLQAGSALKSEFLANMSHELRTPLNAIIGFSDVLKDGVVGPMSPPQHEYVSEIFESGQHLLSLINDILDLSKIEAGKMSLDLEPVEIDTLLRNSLSIIKEKAAQKHLDVKLAIERPIGKTQVDARKTKQIVFNLLSNAVKFTPDGGTIELSAREVGRDAVEAWHESAETTIKMPLAPSAFTGFIEIAVSDTGTGISAADAPRLFQAFSQLDVSVARSAEGTGLGLVLLARLAVLHRGTVAMASTPGKGSKFLVWLPRREAAEEGTEVGALQSNTLKAALTTMDQAEAGTRQALVIEQSETAARLIAQQLTEAGYRVRQVVAARDALALLQQERPDLIVLDVLLPDMDGWELLARIKRSDSSLTKVPVVIVSVVDEQARGFSLGIANVLQKPITREGLMAVLASLGLTRKRASATVLAIDDDPKAVELVAACLAGGSFRVLRAYSGREGVEVCRREIPDLVVLDLLMPDMNGFDVIGELAARSETALIPIVVMTGKSLTGDDRRLLQERLGAAGVRQGGKSENSEEDAKGVPADPRREGFAT